MPAVRKEKNDSENIKTEICSQKKVKEGINALKLLEKKFLEKDLKKQPLLEDGIESPIFLQITLKKIPPPQLLKMIRVPLPHSLITETSEVCLITGDLEKRNHKAEVEPTILHYKNLLKKNGVTQVAQVIPLRQLRTEYKTFESKRQLAAAYDVFLVDKKIAGVVPKTLGKSFFQGRKFPIQIDMKRPNLKEQINKALCQTKFSLACRGNSYALEIARLSMEDDAVLENIMASIEVLANKLPGKEKNIQSLYLKTAKSKAIPIFVSLDMPDDILINKPRKKGKYGLGELSTFDNAEVKVFRDGRVILRKKKEESSSYEDDKNMEEVEDTITTEISPEKKKKRKKDIVDNISDNAEMETEEDDQNSPSYTASSKKKNKKNMNSSYVEADEALEDIRESSMLSKSKKQKIHESDNVSKKARKFKNKDRKVSESEDNGEIEKNVKSKIYMNISEVAEEDFKLKTPKSEKEKVIDAPAEISSKKKKKGKKDIVDNISDNTEMKTEEDNQNSPSYKASTKKKSKKIKNSSHVETDEATEDVNEKPQKFKNKGKKVSENEDSGEIEKDTKSKIHRNISEVAEEDINVKTPKSKKEKIAKDVLDAAEKETSLICIEDKEIMHNVKTPRSSKKMKKGSTEGFITQLTSSALKRKKVNVDSGVKQNLESNNRQKKHKQTCES